MRLDKKVISEIKMGGKGGGEKAFAPGLPDYDRVNESLYDFKNKNTQERLELKKQKDLLRKIFGWIWIFQYKRLIKEKAISRSAT